MRSLENHPVLLVLERETEAQPFTPVVSALSRGCQKQMQSLVQLILERAPGLLFLS